MTEDLAETDFRSADVSDAETPFANLTWSVVDAPENGELSLGDTPSTSIVYLPDANSLLDRTFLVSNLTLTMNGDSRLETSVATSSLLTLLLGHLMPLHSKSTPHDLNSRSKGFLE